MANENTPKSIAPLNSVVDALRANVTGRWADAIKTDQVASVLPEIDFTIGSDSNDHYAKLAWILGHAQANSVPVTALTGPLDECVKNLTETPELRPLAGLVTLLLATRLFERSQLRLSVSLAERAWDLVREDGLLSGPALYDLWLFVVDVFEQELKRSQIRRESKQYQSNIKERLDAIRNVEPKKVDSSDRHPKPQKRAENWSSKAIIERAVNETPSSSANDFEGKNPEPLLRDETLIRDLAAPTAVLNSTKVREGVSLFMRPSSTSIRVIVMIVALLSLITLYLNLPGSVDNEEIGERLAMNIMPGGAETKPVLPLLIGDSGASALEGVTKRLANLKRQREQAPSIANQVNDPEVDQEALKFSGELPPPSTPEAIETEKPAEVPDASKRLPGTIDRRKLPELNTDVLEKQVLESLGAVPGAGEAAGGVTRGGDGRVYGPPLPGAGRGGTALDGSPLKAYPVEELKQPVMYRVIAPTKVLSDPTVVATVIAELRVDALVQVVSRMGNWLEIRSSGGRRGFIYTQDAVAESASR